MRRHILLISPSSVYATKRLVDEATHLNIEVDTANSHELAYRQFDVGKYDALYVRFAHPYYEQAIDLAYKFQSAGKYVVDYNFITSGFDMSKKVLLKQLLDTDVPVPASMNVEEVVFPCVVKWQYGFGGHHVYLVSNKSEFDEVAKKYSPDELIVQEYIEADCEYMVMIVGGKSLEKILKFKIQSGTCKLDPYRYDILDTRQHSEIAHVAEKAARVTRRELAKVDILQRGDQLYVLEVNRSPSLLPFEPYSKLNVAGEFVEYIKSKM